MTIAYVLPWVGLATAVLIYRMQRAASRRRDVHAAFTLLLGVKYGMTEGWGTWFFSNVWLGEDLQKRAQQDCDAILEKHYAQVFPVPTQTVAAVLTSPSAGDLMNAQMIEAANLALYRIGVFNQLVAQQTDFNTRHLPEIRDDTLLPERRKALAMAAFSISHMLHGTGIGNANAPGCWYRDLTDAVEQNVSALSAELTRGWLSRIIYDRNVHAASSTRTTAFSS